MAVLPMEVLPMEVLPIPRIGRLPPQGSRRNGQAGRSRWLQPSRRDCGLHQPACGRQRWARFWREGLASS